jgi:hypothetical protein
MVRAVDVRLDFLVRFARMNLDALSPGDWLNVRQEIRAFIAGYWGGFGEPVRPFPPAAYRMSGKVTSGPDSTTCDTRQIRALWVDTQMQLDMVVGNRELQKAKQAWLESAAKRSKRKTPGAPKEIHAILERVFVEDHTPVSIGIDIVSGTDSMSTPAEPMPLMLNGAIGDVFLTMVRLTLWRVPNTHVRLCAECRLPFVPKRQDSRCCSQACNQRNWWKGSKGQTKLKEIYSSNGWTRGGRGSKKRRRVAPIDQTDS